MSAAARARTAPRQTGMKSLAGALAFLCLVLFLLAIEQKHAVEAWRALRDDAVPAARRAGDWAAQRVSGEATGTTGLKAAIVGDDGPVAALEADVALTGEFGPADAATRDAVGAVNFVGATVRFEAGAVFRTTPLRIAAARELYTVGQTFAGRLDAPVEAQIELRRMVPASRAAAPDLSALCGGQTPGVIAILHRRDRVDLMLFRARTIVGPDAPADALCGHWRFRAR
ncbi:MAG: hypothetical protein ACXW3O_06290 [Brevundimonas sp.]